MRKHLFPYLIDVLRMWDTSTTNVRCHDGAVQAQDATAAAVVSAMPAATPPAAQQLPQGAPPAAVSLVPEQWDALGKRLTRLEASVDAVPQVCGDA
jgi:hypothetical protein